LVVEKKEKGSRGRVRGRRDSISKILKLSIRLDDILIKIPRQEGKWSSILTQRSYPRLEKRLEHRIRRRNCMGRLTGLLTTESDQI